MPSPEDTSSLPGRLDTILGRLEAAMPVWNDSAALLVQLEATLPRLGAADFEGRAACLARLEAIAAAGRLLHRHLGDALKEMEGFGPTSR